MHNTTQKGFTIVEILIVVVVISILATITIVGFGAVRSRAIDTTLKVDAENGAKVLANDYTLNGLYPVSTAAANGGRGLTPTKGNTYTYSYNNSVFPQTYSLSASNPDSSNTYAVTSTNNVPTLVAAAPAPVITLQPESWTNYSHIFTSAATGSPTPTVQWQKSLDGATGWTNIAGATSPNLNTSDSVPCNPTYFRALYTNSGGTTSTNVVYLIGPCGD